MSTATASALPKWACEALEGVYSGERLYVQREERGVTFRD